MIVLERLPYPLRTRTWELRDRGLVPSTEEILKWSAQAAEGMQYLHEKNVFQVDIGLHNMLLDWDENIKYCDFSGSSIDGEKPTAVVSPHAQHPGIKIGSPTVQSELFSLGSALYEISTTHKPYEGMKEIELQARYANGEYPKTDHFLLGPVIVKCWSGAYDNAGEAAAEIRAIQRKIKLGDLTLSLHDIIQQKENQNMTKGAWPLNAYQLFASGLVFNKLTYDSAATVVDLYPQRGVGICFLLGFASIVTAATTWTWRSPANPASWVWRKWRRR